MEIKAKLENISGVDYLVFKLDCSVGLMSIPVIIKGSREKYNAWTWNGSIEKPTLKPSVRTQYFDNEKGLTEIHYWLNNGVCECLPDCKDGNAGKNINLLNFSDDEY